MASATGGGSVFRQLCEGPALFRALLPDSLGGELPDPSLTSNLEMEMLPELFVA